MKTREEQVEEDLRKKINSKSRLSDRKSTKSSREIHEIKPSSPSHPKNLYGSASSMTTNLDW